MDIFIETQRKLEQEIKGGSLCLTVLSECPAVDHFPWSIRILTVASSSSCYSSISIMVLLDPRVLFSTVTYPYYWPVFVSTFFIWLPLSRRFIHYSRCCHLSSLSLAGSIIHSIFDSYLRSISLIPLHRSKKLY